MKFEYKCNHCNHNDIAVFIGFTNLYFIKCSKCYHDSLLIGEVEDDKKEDLVFTFVSKKERLKNITVKHKQRRYTNHYDIKKVYKDE